MNQPDLAQMTRAAMALTKDVTTRWTARLAGSESCLACGDYLKEQLATFCDHTDSQEFDVRPGAFLGYIRINIILFFFSLIALYVQYIVLATSLASLALMITVLEFFIYKEFVDFLFPLKKGKNVFGQIEPSGEVKQQIIISAHHDSAHIFNFLEKEPASYVRRVIGGTLSQLLLFLFTWLLLLIQLLGTPSLTLHWVLTGILTVAGLSVWRLWFFYAKEGTPGAGDNLVCTALAMEVGRYFARQKRGGNSLQQTRIIIASWDAEECGLRGARAYTKQYKTDLQSLPTYNFNLECMYDHRELKFLVSDLNNFVPLSTKMAMECTQAAKQLGLEMGIVKFPFLAGGTDAAEFAKIGVEATTLAAMSWTIKEDDVAYHTTRDTVEAVDEEAVSQSMAVAIQYVLDKDRQSA